MKTLIRPYVGGTRLDKLRPSDVEKWLGELATAGKSASTRRQALTILRAMLDTAVRDGVIATNVAAVVTRPTLRRAEAKHFDVTSVGALIAAAEGDRLRPLLITLLGTGLRRGEALALQGAHRPRELRVRGTLVRTDSGLVIQPPKTARGWRTLPLSAPVVAALRAQRQQQRLDRLAAGISWIATDHVFTTIGRHPARPAQHQPMVHDPGAAGRRRGLDACHEAHRALGQVNAGVPLAVVSRVAGHESINITVDIYGHVSEQSARDAVDAAAGALGLG